MTAPERIDIPNPHLSYICRNLTRRPNPFHHMPNFESLVSGKNRIAGILFTLIVREAFKLTRYPGFEDRLLGSRMPDLDAQVLLDARTDREHGRSQSAQARVTTDRLKALMAVRTWFEKEPAAARIIEDCAKALVCLQRKQIKHYGTRTHLTLYRKIGWLEGESLTPYMLAIHHAVEVARQKNQTHVDLDMDTVTHWSHDPNAYGYGENRISIRCDIPVTDVLLDSHLIAGDHPLTSGIEGGEVLVVSRSPKGLMPIPLDAITFEGPAFERVTRDGTFPARLPVRVSEDMVDYWHIAYHDHRPTFADLTLPGLLKAWWHWRTRRT
jgi:hypothetical protein